MILCEQDLRDFGFEFSLDLAGQIAARLTNRDIELVVLDEKAMRALNFEQRGVNKATDVLSFPLENVPSVVNSPLGSIVINANAVFAEAKRLGHSEKAEFALLFLHGLLHLLGYNHEIDNGEMREKEKELIAEFKLPKSLIIRTL